MFFAKNISKSVKKKSLVRCCSFQINRGEIAGVFGPNGAGKSTSFYLMAGLIFPDSGSISMDNCDITNLSLAQRSRRGIAYLPQDSSVFEGLSVYDNLMMALEIGNFPRDKRVNQLLRVMEQMQISYLRHSLVQVLSGGERRRVEIARCLTLNPKYLFLDEPTAGLDPLTVGDLCTSIKNLADNGVGVFITDHNIKDIIPIVDHAYVMYGGEIVTSGRVEDVVKNDLVQKIYLGRQDK